MSAIVLAWVYVDTRSLTILTVKWASDIESILEVFGGALYTNETAVIETENSYVLLT